MVEPEPEVRLPYDDIMSLLGSPEYHEWDPAVAKSTSHRICKERFEFVERVEQLKKCHEHGHARRFDLMQEIQRDLAFWHRLRYQMDQRGFPVDADFWIMHEDGLAALIMDIAFDKTIYVLDGGTQETYLHHIHSSVYACLCGYLRMVTKPEYRRRYLKAAKSYLERANRLCIMLWSNRDQILSIMTDTPHAYGGGEMQFTMIRRMLELTYAIIKLHHVCYKQVQQLTYGRVYHIALYVWTKTRNLHYSEMVWHVLSIGIGEQGPVTASGPDANVIVRQFLEESVMQAKRQKAVATTISYLLSNRGVFDRALANYLSVYHMMITACPSIIRSLPTTLLEQLRDSCSIAFQRQMCSGGTDGNMVFTYEVIKTSMYVISYTWEDLFKITSAGGRMTLAMATTFWEEATSIKLLPLMQALFVLHITQERANKDFLTMLCSLLAICRQAVAKLRNEPRLSTDAQGLLHTVLVFMHSLWYPVRECLEPIEERPKDRHQIWLPLAESWEELGLACGLSAAYPKIESPKPWSEQITHFGVIAFSREGCSWPQCLCALDPHHGMKICKGCWPTRQVRYCSHQCQQMDWRRHQAECHRYTSSNSHSKLALV